MPDVPRSPTSTASTFPFPDKLAAHHPVVPPRPAPAPPRRAIARSAPKSPSSKTSQACSPTQILLHCVCNTKLIHVIGDPSLLANFQFWRSAVFYIALILTVGWILAIVWGWRSDLRDKKKEEEKEQEKKDKKEEKLQKS